MSADKYRFVSPGVFITEVDQSQVPTPGVNDDGPIIIGRSAQGPAYKPTRVHSYNEFVQIFGDTVAGGRPGDVWRSGNFTTPMYATYAAKAYLSNNNPVTFVRMLGAQDQNASTTDPAAGAAGWGVGDLASDGQDGAYGLFVMPSASVNITGTLAAIFYCTGAAPVLSGTNAYGTGQQFANAAVLKEIAPGEFRIHISGSNSRDQVKVFNFTPNSPKFIRKVFNTNPIKTNGTTQTSTSQENYWLGETFEKAVASLSGSNKLAVIVGLESGSTQFGDFYGLSGDGGPTACQTGWFISQDVNEPSAAFNATSSTTQLFKLHGLTANGAETQNRVKVTIRDIRFPSAQEESVNPYPSFTVQLRNIKDTDLRPIVLETFTNCNLNPNSENFISRKIGDRYEEYNQLTGRLDEYGDYDNASKYVRVEVNDDIKTGQENVSLAPFGVLGPLKYKTMVIPSGSNMSATVTSSLAVDSMYQTSSATDTFGNQIAMFGVTEGITLQYPSIALIASSSDMGFSKHRDAYFGVNLLQQGSTNRFDDSTYDLLRVKPTGVGTFVAGGVADHQYAFTLDNIVLSGTDAGVEQSAYANNVNEFTPAFYLEGSRGTAASGRSSYTALSGAAALVNDRRINKFTTVMFGGNDGLDITEGDPFRNTKLAEGTDLTNYAKASFTRALNIISDAETTSFDLAAVPGITNVGVTDKLIDVCEERGDALAVIDLENDYQPLHEGNPGSYPALPNVQQAVTSMRNRSTDSSYGCAFFPWVQTRDVPSGQLIWIPPSVVGLGTLGSSAARTELWFAPAGFNRGGLSQGAGGVAVTNVRTKLTSQQRDDLYDVRINPIASFPTEGIVVFGQKTLQLQRSALDRINVRRLMIFLKKKISQIANTILFDQNVQTTWDRFKGQAEPLLEDVQSRFGLEDYKLILDDTTTTADLRDRNTMYAKVFLKPAKAIEFIAIDFFITSSGASFED